jgi:NADH dehydrogenase FAD-containing subunit
VPAFRYRDLGSMATIGRKRAVAQIGVFKTSGLVAWLLWSLAHIYWLSQPPRCRYELVLELCYVSARNPVDHRHFRLTH